MNQIPTFPITHSLCSLFDHLCSLPFYKSHTISRLDASSCTDMDMKWKKKDGKALYEGRPIADMCHVSASESVTVEKRGAVFKEMLQVLPNSMLFSHLRNAQAVMSREGPPSGGEEPMFKAIVDGSMQLDAELLASLEPIGLSESEDVLYEKLRVGVTGALSIMREYQGSPRWVAEREREGGESLGVGATHCIPMQGAGEWSWMSGRAS